MATNIISSQTFGTVTYNLMSDGSIQAKTSAGTSTYQPTDALYKSVANAFGGTAGVQAAIANPPATNANVPTQTAPVAAPVAPTQTTTTTAPTQTATTPQSYTYTLNDGKGGKLTVNNDGTYTLTRSVAQPTSTVTIDPTTGQPTVTASPALTVSNAPITGKVGDATWGTLTNIPVAASSTGAPSLSSIQPPAQTTTTTAAPTQTATAPAPTTTQTAAPVAAPVAPVAPTTVAAPTPEPTQTATQTAAPVAAPVAPTAPAAPIPTTTAGKQAALNAAYAGIQTASSNGTLTQAMLDNYASMAQQYGLPAVSTTLYQNQVNRQSASQKAQASFTLPTGNNNTTTTQTATDPSGTTYTFVPGTGGQAGQWYKQSGNGYQAVDSKGVVQTNAPVIPSQSFNTQLQTAQNAVAQQAQQQAQQSALSAFQNSDVEKAYTSALNAYQTEAAKSNPDLTTLQNLYNNLDKAQSDLQKSDYASGQYTSGAIQSQTGALTQQKQQLTAAQDAAQQAAAKQAQLAAQQQQLATAQKNAISSLQNDYKNLSPGAQSVLGDLSKVTDVTQLAQQTQNAYNNALNAYNSYKGNDVNQQKSLATALQDAAMANKVAQGATYGIVPQDVAAKNAQQAQQQFVSSQPILQQANKAVDVQQLQQAMTAARATGKRSDGLENLMGGIGLIALTMLTGGLFDTAAAAFDAAEAVSEMAASGASEGEIASTLVNDYGIDSAAADQLAGQTADAVTNGVTSDELTSAGFDQGTANEIAQAPVQAGPVAPEPTPAPVEAAPVTPEPTPAPPTVQAGPVGPVEAPVEAPVAPEAPVEAPTQAPTQAPVSEAPVAPEAPTNAPVAPTETPPGTIDVSKMTQEELNQALGQPVPPSGPGIQVASTEPTAGFEQLGNQEPYKIDISGVAGSTEAPSAVTGPLSEGTSLATPAQIDSGAATWNASANAWEVPTTDMGEITVTASRLPAISPEELALGAGAVGLGAAALGGGGGGAAAAPVAAAPTSTPVAPTTTAAPAPTTTTTPVAPTTTSNLPPVQDAGTAATAPGANPVLPAGPTEVIPPGTSSVAPVEAQVVAPTDGLPPVTDATVIPAEGGGLPGSVASGGLSATDVALLAAGWKLVNGVLTPPAPAGFPGYTPVGPTQFGTAEPVKPSAMNPGYLTIPGVVQPQVPGATGTQTSYNWGVRPLIQNPSDINQWNVAPTKPQFLGATSAQGVGANQMNLQGLIKQTLGQGAALSAYPRAVMPPVQPTIQGTQSINDLVNQTLGLGQQASAYPTTAGPVAPRV